MFLYLPQFLSENDHLHLLDELSRVQLSDENNRMAPGRLRAFIQPGMKTHQVFTSRQMTEYFSYVFEKPLVHGSDVVPIEYRKYPSGSQGMKWHHDVQLIGRQYECVYTLTNTSDSQTKWRDLLGKEHAIWAEPNSLIVVQAGGVEHAVTPVTSGERTIVKFIFCHKD
jgi:hypothetical protein